MAQQANTLTKKGGYTRHFSAPQYENIEWLTGCDAQVKLFCWPCLLFSHEGGDWYKQGCRDIEHLTSALKEHERSEALVQAFMAFKIFGKRGLTLELTLKE